MGKRSTARRLAMQALYQADHGMPKIEDALYNLCEEEDYHEDTKTFAAQLANGAWSKKEEIDSVIKKYAKDWKLERISGVDRSVLRLALFELMEEKTPHQIVINEAIELAKKYSGAEAAKFINGILGAYVKNAK